MAQSDEGANRRTDRQMNEQPLVASAVADQRFRWCVFSSSTSSHTLRIRYVSAAGALSLINEIIVLLHPSIKISDTSTLHYFLLITTNAAPVLLPSQAKTLHRFTPQASKNSLESVSFSTCFIISSALFVREQASYKFFTRSKKKE